MTTAAASGSARPAESGTQGAAGGVGLGRQIGLAGQGIHQGGGEKFVVPGSPGIHAVDHPEELGRTPRFRLRGFGALNLSAGQQGIEMKPHGVEMNIELVGDGGDAHRSIGSAQHRQHVGAPAVGVTHCSRGLPVTYVMGGSLHNRIL